MALDPSLAPAPASAPESVSVPTAPAWWARWLPRSLFARLVWVLASGLLVAQLLSAAINLAERDRLVLASSGLQQAQRITDVVQLLDSLDSAERERIVAVLSVPPLVLSLHDAPVAASASEAVDSSGPRALMFTSLLRNTFGDDRPVRVEAGTAPPRGLRPPGAASHPHHPGAWGLGAGRERPGLGERGRPVHLAEGRLGPVLRVQVQLRDGRWARFDNHLPPQASTALPVRLALTLGVLLVAVLGLSYVAVRWATRPVQLLAEAADALGRDIHRPPLPEEGPQEIRQAAQAFNTMQARLVRYLDDRTRILAAMSHDLKTPITRMRLRAELLDDEALRQRFEADLQEMQGMVTHTLEFMRGLGGNEPRQPVDVMALLESLQADNLAMGRAMRIEGQATAPLRAVPSLLKRCLANLVDNAVLYGQRATVQVEDSAERLVLRILDEGPGIPDAADRAQVFEPFHRLEASRNRATGGTGLGLTIARDIAQGHGGDLTLQQRPEGGLEAVLSLPRLTPPPAPRAAPCAH